MRRSNLLTAIASRVATLIICTVKGSNHCAEFGAEDDRGVSIVTTRPFPSFQKISEEIAEGSRLGVFKSEQMLI